MRGDWHKGKVLKGTGEGRTIGFPTLNLTPSLVDDKIKQGIYACLVRYQRKIYPAVLFYGPRLVKKEHQPVLEIYLMGFQKDLYGKTVEFRIVSYIRRVRYFEDMEKLREEINNDIDEAKQILGLAKKDR